jgi:hypothetical protein
LGHVGLELLNHLDEKGSLGKIERPGGLARLFGECGFDLARGSEAFGGAFTAEGRGGGLEFRADTLG